MLDSRLHAFGRNSPLRGRQIKLLEHHEELVRSDVGDGASSQGRKDVALQDSRCIFDRVGGELTVRDARLREFKPLACDDFEGMCARRTLFFAVGTWIDVPCEEPE